VGKGYESACSCKCSPAPSNPKVTTGRGTVHTYSTYNQGDCHHIPPSENLNKTLRRPLFVQAASICNGCLYWYRPPLLVQAAFIGTGRLYLYRPPLFLQAASIVTGHLYYYRPPLLVQAASIRTCSLYWYRGLTVLLPARNFWK
jgi:hypothetical protein